MIQKVSLYFILPMCIIAFFLALVGVQHINFDDSYYSFIRNVSLSFDRWKIEIPDIPKINDIQASSYNSNGGILEVLIRIGNFFVKFINIISTILNVIINVVNIVIQLIQFVLTVIYQCKDFINRQANVRVLVCVN